MSDQLCECGCGKPKRERSKYASDRCKNRASEKRHPGRHKEYQRNYQRKYWQTHNRRGKTKSVEKKCTCGDFKNCLTCRNRERRRAFKAGDWPVYRLLPATGD